MARRRKTRRLRGRRPLVCTGIALVSSLAVAGTSYAVAPTAVPRSVTVCGGLVSDAHFRHDVSRLGRAHACEHLRIERADRHTSVIARIGQAVSTEAAYARAVAKLGVTAPAKVGRWSVPRDPGTSAVGVSAVLLHTGKVLLLGQVRTPAIDTPGFIFNPATGTGHSFVAPGKVFCGAVVPLSDGRILSVGGANPLPRGIVDVWLFDPVTEQWTRQPDTVKGRYYPTTTRLPDGRVVVAAGTELDGRTRNPDVEVYTPPAASSAVGTLRVVGPPHPTSVYPQQVVMPSGRMLQVERNSSFLLNPASWSWSALPQMPAQVGSGAAHLLLPGGPQGSRRVMVVGGLDAAQVSQATAQTIDLSNRAAGWTRGPSLPSGRSHMNVVQVPDGSAYGIGGNGAGLFEAPDLTTLHFNPATGRWASAAVEKVRRAYHSTALLLPDGRIMAAGDNVPGGGLQQIDFYKPPYLFKGARPKISLAPRRIAYGQRFAVQTTGPKPTSAVLMAPSATTHANDMNARRVQLAVTRTAKGLSVVAPPTANVAPPGYYMLFVLNAKGVPSVAKWVRVGA